MIDFSNVDIPFNTNDLLGSSMELIGFFSSFILLGLTVVFAPKIINLLKETILNYRYYNRYDASDYYGGRKPTKYQMTKRSIRKAWEYRNE